MGPDFAKVPMAVAALGLSAFPHVRLADMPTPMKERLEETESMFLLPVLFATPVRNAGCIWISMVRKINEIPDEILGGVHWQAPTPASTNSTKDPLELLSCKRIIPHAPLV